ncbi:MAG: glycosyl transferase family 2, partial [Candidatus Faecalibacterium intestinavium]|nr:glycosyl transferase family 2 [Candidatus Faecalibacterium intestinavium]
ARRWWFRAIGEAPWLREPWLDLAALLCEEEDWQGVLYLTGSALKIQQRPRGYFSEGDAWGSRPYDLAALGSYYTGDYTRALAMADQALARSPKDQRLIRNRALILRKAAPETPL